MSAKLMAGRVSTPIADWLKPRLLCDYHDPNATELSDRDAEMHARIASLESDAAVAEEFRSRFGRSADIRARYRDCDEGRPVGPADRWAILFHEEDCWKDHPLKGTIYYGPTLPAVMRAALAAAKGAT